MSHREPEPGICREKRIGDAGLQRLERHLQRGAKISDAVLSQWVKRYGNAARELLKQYGAYHTDLE